MAGGACTSGGPSPTPTPTASGEVLRFGYPSEPPTLDPLGAGGASAATRDILRPVLPSLFRLNARLRPEPDLAARWPGPADIGLDPFSVRLTLRRANWSDGRPITAEDVRFSLDRLKRGPTGYRYRFLTAVDVHGPREFTLRFDRRVRRWWSLFSFDDMVLPAHAYSDAWQTRPTVSGGPFAVGEWTEGLRVRLVRNESYWGPKPILAGIDVVFVPDDETRFQLLERGELDAFFSEGEINIGRRARARGHQPVGGPLEGEGAASGAWGPTWWELGIERGTGPGVSRAIVEATDPSLVAEILEDSGAVMDGIPAVFPVRAGRIGGAWAGRGDLAEARDAAGRGGERTIDITFPRGAGGALATFMHFRLRHVGITAELLGLEDDAFERILDTEEPQVVLRLRRGADAADAAAYASASGEPGAGPVDDDVERAETGGAGDALTPGLDREGWVRAQEGLERAAAAAPLARVRTWIVGREGVAGPHALGASTGPLWNAEAWRFL